MKQGKRFFLFLTNALLLNLGAVGAVLSASSGFGMESGWLPVAMGSGTACLATALLSFGRKRGRWMLLLWGVWAVILLVGHTSFREGFCGFVYEVTSDYHVWFANVPVLFMRASREALQFFLGMMVSVTALLLAVTVLVWRSFAASLLVTLPAFCLPLVVTQVAADLPLLSVMLFWVLMLFSQVFRRVDPVRAAKTVWMLMPVVLVLLGGLLWVIPHEKKEPSSWALEIQKTVSTWATRAAEGKSPLQLGVTSKVPVFEWTNLEQAGPRVYTGQTMLKVTCTADGTYYLRGEARGDYTGTRWDKPLSDAQLGEVLLWPGMMLAESGSGITAQMTITSEKDKTNLLYTPYWTFDADGACSTSDGGFTRAGRTSWSVQFLPQQAVDFQLLHADTAMYDAYVEENYLALPEDTAQTVGRLAREAGLSSEMEPSWLAQEAVRFVQEDKRYDSQTPYQPENEDFVVYFLTHSQRGYCVHFASAVTVTLRAMGVPARYVNGYLVTVKNGQADVKDENAHAWVEYYEAGVGWIPIEATPGYSQNVLQTNQSQIVSESEPEPPAASAPENPPSQGVSEIGSPAESSPAQPQTETESAEISRELLTVLLVVVGTMVLGWLRREWVLRQRDKRQNQKNSRRASVAVWKQLRRITAKPPQRAKELAEKAVFSRQGLSLQELEEMKTILQQCVRRRRAGSGALRRFVDQWILVLYS